MGYYTRVTGRIEIHPPIPWGRVKDSGYLAGDPYGWPKNDGSVLLRVDEHHREVELGYVVEKAAIAIDPSSEDSYRAYSVDTDVQRIVDQYGKGHTFTGYLHGEGEENGDVWRVYVDEYHLVHRVEPAVSWPSGPWDDA